jgi:hypothetical protein
VAQFSDYALNEIATNLSQFTNPVIPELILKDDKTLQNHILESVLGIFSGGKNAYVRHLIANEVRRTFACMETYKLGRKYALEYVAGDRHWNITPYFLALTFFESCVAYSWQICDQVMDIGGKKGRVFEPGDGSAWERLHRIYTTGTKHSHRAYDAGLHDKQPTTVWLANEGIQCLSGESITYQELLEIIAANNDLYYEIQKVARDHVQSKRSNNQETCLP